MKGWAAGVLAGGVLAGVLAAGAMAAGALPAAAQEVVDAATAREVLALEGDRLSIDGQMIRLYGIDAPDPGQRCVTARRVEYDCFEMSRLALTRVIEAAPPVCTLMAGSQDGARLGRCTVNGQDVGGFMVMSGWAMAFRRVSQEYTRQEAQAMSRRRGLWNGRAEAPWIWRDRRLQGAG